MTHTIGHIAGKNTDFKKCKECGCINWYENESCHNCGFEKFKRFTQKDGKQLLIDYSNTQGWEDMTEEIEIDT